MSVEQKRNNGFGSSEAQPQVLPPLPSAIFTFNSRASVYVDARPGFAPHKAIIATVSVSPGIIASKFLMDCLGEADARQLMLDWGDRVDFGKMVPAINEVVLFSDSNNKARDAKSAYRGAETTQEADFKASHLNFADDLQAIIVCAVLVKKAREAKLNLSAASTSWSTNQPNALNKLTETEIGVLKPLRGVVRTLSGALGIDGRSRLRGNYYYDYAFPSCLAFGGEASAA